MPFATFHPASAASAAPAAVVERVRERLRAERTDPARDPEAVARLARVEVRRHNDFALARGLAPVDDEVACVREVLASVSGYGPLQPYLDDPEVEELWLNAPDREFSKGMFITVARRRARADAAPCELTNHAQAK